MRLLVEDFTRHNSNSVRRLTQHLRVAGYVVNKKRFRRLVRLMDYKSVYPKSHVTVTG